MASGVRPVFLRNHVACERHESLQNIVDYHSNVEVNQTTSNICFSVDYERQESLQHIADVCFNVSCCLATVAEIVKQNTATYVNVDINIRDMFQR